MSHDEDSTTRAPELDLAPTLQAGVPFKALAALKEGEGLLGSLLVIAGAAGDIGTHHVIGEGCVLGRDPQNFLLRDPEISRRHCEVQNKNGLHILRDLESTNGTAHNGRPLDDAVILRNGDKFNLGRTVIKFTLVDPLEAECLENMAALAGSDPLTGLMAKHRFDAMLTEGFEAAVASNKPLCVLMLDMDGLKAINDAHGHQMGAHTIAEVGRMIGRIVGLSGEACRFGGDEFSVFLPGAPLGVGMRVGERVRQAVEEATFTLDGGTSNPTISIGVAELTLEMGSVRELVAAADLALYRAKDQGRNVVSS